MEDLSWRNKSLCRAHASHDFLAKNKRGSYKIVSATARAKLLDRSPLSAPSFPRNFHDPRSLSVSDVPEELGPRPAPPCRLGRKTCKDSTVQVKLKVRSLSRMEAGRLPRNYIWIAPRKVAIGCKLIRPANSCKFALRPDDSGQQLRRHICCFHSKTNRSRSQVARGAALGHLPTPRPPSSGNGWPAWCFQHLLQLVSCPVFRVPAQPMAYACATSILWLGPTQCATPQYCNSRSGGFRKHATLANGHCPAQTCTSHAIQASLCH